MENNYYSKKSLWKWILLYLAIGAVAYGLIYYFFFYKKGGYNYNSQNYQTQTQNNSNQTADWKTYTNSEYGFEIKYPAGNSINQIKEDVLGNKAESPNQCTQISYENSFVYISLPPHNILCGGTTGFGVDSIKLEEQLNIGGKIYYAKGWKLGPNYEFLSFQTDNGLNISYGIIEGLSSTNYETSKDLNYQILSTFKFTK